MVLRESICAKIYPAFAHIVPNGPARTDTLYQRWVDKLASKEYADELVLVAVAMGLSIRLVVFRTLHRQQLHLGRYQHMGHLMCHRMEAKPFI